MSDDEQMEVEGGGGEARDSIEENKKQVLRVLKDFIRNHVKVRSKERVCCIWVFTRPFRYGGWKWRWVGGTSGPC